MAILKAVNVKAAGRRKFREVLAYVSDREKTGTDREKVDRFMMGSWINRCLQGKQTRNRQFKQFIISMQAVWPKEPLERGGYEVALGNVLHTCETYFMEKGYWASAWIHCNTAHPHFHLLLETCNAYHGRQYAQSYEELREFKRLVSVWLLEQGLREEILMDVKELTEEEYLQEEELEFKYDISEPDLEDEEEIVFDDVYSNFTGENAWNIGTLEHTGMLPSQYLKEMVVYVKEKCDMCRIVSEEERKRGRIMCSIVPEGGENG